MERGQFDALARLIAAQRSRRAALAAFLGATLLGTLAPITAKRKGKHGARRRGDKGSAKKSKDAGKTKRRAAKDRKAPRPAAAAAARCCSTGACTPGKGKNLSKCCFQGQDLTGKNFSGANLGSANFSRATLTGANLQAANLDKACLVDADLRGVKANSSTNLGTAIYCRTRTDSGENNAGCDKGTPCCPTCDAAHPCDAGRVCCAGRCIPGDCCDNGDCGDGAICCANRCAAGDCCATADCPNRTCERRSCQDNQCAYEPVFGQPGPRCQTTCCEDAQGNPVCCDAGVAICQPSGACGCGGDPDCGADQRCCRGACIPRTVCCDGNNPEGCNADLHCCDSDGSGVCRECCDAEQCPDETCETKTCNSNGTCAYTPVFDDPGPGCATVCCENANEQPVCCPDGTTLCTASKRCRCEGAADCAANQICCNGACIANTQCCAGDPTTCPAPGVCQVRACADGACQPRGVSGGSCPLLGGGTGTCRDGACVCPSPRITCNGVCCIDGVTQCAANGTCPQLCDVCPSGCPFTSVTAAVAGTPAGGTIRICPGTYTALNVTVDKNLTIIGAGGGADGTILDGQRTTRIFTIGDDNTVTIRDLTVTRGQGTGSDNTGAGILVRFNAALTLDRVEVIDNDNDSGFALGAVHVSTGSSLLLKESRVANNRLSSAFGGGIYTGNDATVTLDASRIDGNSAGFGGGIWINVRGTVNLDDDSIVTANHAQNPSRGSGGGIYNKGTVNGATTSNITGNTRGSPPVPDNCANALRFPAPGSGTGCPA